MVSKLRIKNSYFDVINSIERRCSKNNTVVVSRYPQMATSCLKEWKHGLN